MATEAGTYLYNDHLALCFFRLDRALWISTLEGRMLVALTLLLPFDRKGMGDGLHICENVNYVCVTKAVGSPQRVWRNSI